MKILNKEKKYSKIVCDFILNFSNSKDVAIKLIGLCKSLEGNIKFKLTYVKVNGFGDIGEPKFLEEFDAPIKSSNIINKIQNKSLEEAKLQCIYDGIKLSFVILSSIEDIRVICDDENIDIDHLLQEIEKRLPRR